MSVRTGTLIWTAIALTVTIALLITASRLGRDRAASWLVVVGLVVLAIEEPLLGWYWALADPRTDPDGMATLVTAPARAHVMDSALLGFAFLVLLGWIALTAFRRGERWAAWTLRAGWALVAATILLTVLTVYPRGLDGGTGYGWEQLAVGLFAWACGLFLVRVNRPAPVEAR